MTESKRELVVFLDLVGRTIIGEKREETPSHLVVKNPAVVNIAEQIVPNSDGNAVKRMALQLFPLFFREFLATKEEPIVFRYNKNNITPTDGTVILDFKVGIQYDQLFANVGELTQAPNVVQTPQSPQQTPQQTPQQEPHINLFDE